ncbi:MAG: molybdopterin-guanine dinucleotide biosynthesis protein B [Candidatus Heimdallarchaeota archaeon]
MIVLSVIGHSGSGKTYLITKAIKLLKNQLNLNSSVIKNIHEHKIDIEGKDSHRFIDAGAQYSVIRNRLDENAIFFNKKVELHKLIEWIKGGPFKTDIIFIEGFRNLRFPTILCIKELSEVSSQLTNKVKMISGFITANRARFQTETGIPVVDIVNDFERFLNIFKIK